MGKRQRSRDSSGDQKRSKNADGEGDYPPPHVLESKLFESYYRECGVVPEDEWEAFIGRLKQPLGVSFRITGHDDDPASISLRNYMEKVHIAKLANLVMDEQPVPPPYPIAWYPGRMAWRFDVSRSILRGKGALKNDDSPAARTLGAFHNFLMAETELGAISRQEEVSMVPPRLLDVQPGHVVADLCAAPGSKTQQLIEAINPPCPIEGDAAGEGGAGEGGEAGEKAEAGTADAAGDAGAAAAEDAAAAEGAGDGVEDSPSSAPRATGPSGLVIANDMDYKRCHLLVRQVKRLNSPALIVTNHDATMLPTRMAASLNGVGGSSGTDKSLRFDRVLCDVPCSGDGTLRKAPDLWRRWSDGLGLGVHRSQLNILQRGLQMLKPGGKLVYSTCSMNPIEDEAVVAHALLELGPANFELVDASDQLPALKRCAGVDTWRVRADGVWYTSYASVPSKVVASRKLLPSMFAPSADELRALNIERCMRVLPHLQDTGGFFIAVLRRSETTSIPNTATLGHRSAGNAEAAGEGATADGADAAPTSVQSSWPGRGFNGEGSAEVRDGDWTCGSCGANVFAYKTACFRCGTPKGEAGEAGAKAEAGEAGGAVAEAANGEEEETADVSAAAGDAAGSSAAAASSDADAMKVEGGAVEGGGGGAGAGGQLVSRIASQQNQQPGAHVLEALHCSPRNNGKYDAMYTLTPAWHAELSSFFGLSEHFPSAQLVTRSIGGKAIFFIGSGVLKLLAADTQSKLKLVNTGTRVIEKVEAHPGIAWPFRLSQDGVHCLVQHMSRQRLFASTPDILDLLRRRTMPLSSFRNERFKEALLAAEPGAIAIVHDVHDTGDLVAGQPMPLVLAATRTPTDPPSLELAIKQAESLSLYNRTAHG